MDSTRIFVLIFLAITLSNFSGVAQDQGRIDSFKILANQANTSEEKLKAFKNLCWEYATTRIKLDSARIYADSLQALSLQEKDVDNLAMSDFYYGLIGRFGGNYHDALHHLDKYLEHFVEKGDSVKIEFGLYQKGVILYNLGNYAESLEHYYAVQRIYEKFEMHKSIATTWHSIAHIQREMKNYEGAIENYEKAIKVEEKLDDKSGLILNLMSLGNTYAELEKYEIAEQKLLEAYEICRVAEVDYIMVSIKKNLGDVYQKSGEYEKAKVYFEDALELFADQPSKKDLAWVLQSLGENSTSLKNYANASKYLMQSNVIAKEIDSKPILLENYKALKELNHATGNLENAIKYQELHMVEKDSIFDQDKNKQLLELETKYKVEQKEKDIQLLVQESELKEAQSAKEATLRKNLIIGLLLALLISALLIYAMWQRFSNQKKLIEKNEEIKKAQYGEQLQTLEMKALRAQMNPHFLFNCLNSINTMILDDDNENASKYLSKFSKLVRSMLENSAQSSVSLKDELSMLTSYIELEDLRFNNRIDFKIEVEKSIDQEDTYLPSMILQPFVENAIWHGLLQSKKKGSLSVLVREDEDNLYCTIRDNGIGREKSTALKKESGSKKKSMGINITTERLRLLTRQKVNEIINIVDLKDANNNALGTEVNIQFPIS